MHIIIIILLNTIVFPALAEGSQDVLLPLKPQAAVTHQQQLVKWPLVLKEASRHIALVFTYCSWTG